MKQPNRWAITFRNGQNDGLDVAILRSRNQTSVDDINLLKRDREKKTHMAKGLSIRKWKVVGRVKGV